MFKNKKFNKFVSVLCSSLVLSSVAPVIKHAHAADPLFTITKNPDGSDCLKLIDNVLFVVVTARTIDDHTDKMYEHMICECLNLNKDTQNFTVKSVPTDNIYHNLLHLIENEPSDRPITIAMELPYSLEQIGDYQIPFALAVTRTQTEIYKYLTARTNLKNDIQQTSFLKWSEKARDAKRTSADETGHYESSPWVALKEVCLTIEEDKDDHWTLEENHGPTYKEKRTSSKTPFYLTQLKTITDKELTETTTELEE